MVERIEIRTSFAGVNVKRSELNASERIGKKYGAVCVDFSDKSVTIEVNDGRAFKRDMAEAKIAYLIDTEIDNGGN